MYKLNNTEIDIRRRIGEDIKDDYVHRKGEIFVDTKITKKKEDNNEESKKNKKQEKRYLTISGVKEKNIVVNAEKQGDYFGDSSEGDFFDKKT